MIGFLNMTALVPTIGHQYLVSFAASFMQLKKGTLYVVISGRSFEPIAASDRRNSFIRQFKAYDNVIITSVDDDAAPQQDDGTQEFWDYWVKIATDATGGKPVDYLFASETYGQPYADQLGAQFIPCDIKRETFDVRGTDVRSNLLENFDHIMPEFRQHIARRITVFGSDSTGKTTMTLKLKQAFEPYSTSLVEWARPYLETVGTEVTIGRMLNIIAGQFAMQQASSATKLSPLVFQDTDMLTTIGYHRIYGMDIPDELIEGFKRTKADLYLVMNSGIPFEKDPLRYGNGARESTDQFWIDLLEEFDCEYKCVTEVVQHEQIAQAVDHVTKFVKGAHAPIEQFDRNA